MSHTPTQKVLNYYSSLESKWGYSHITWKTKHFGYYPNGKPTISEKKAQVLMQEEVAHTLQLKPNQRILDAGCGYGTTACYLAKKYKVQITGIDINENEITDAKLRSTQDQLEKYVSFDVQDYSETSFPDNFFDGIYTLETLSHAPDLTKTLREFFRILKPGGKIALFEYTLAPDKYFSADDMEKLERGIKGTAALGLKSFRHDTFPKVLEHIGFTSVQGQNISSNCKPSLTRLKNIATIPYFFVNLFKLHSFFVNTVLAIEWYELANKGLIRYCIFTGKKL